MKSWLGRFGTCPYVRCVQKVCSKKIMPNRASVGDGVLDVPRYGVRTSRDGKKYCRGRCHTDPFFVTICPIGHKIMVGQVWNLPLRYAQKNHMPDRA